MSDKSTLTIYMELRDLVDTRLNALELMGYDITSIGNKDWVSRTSDSIGGLSHATLQDIITKEPTQKLVVMPRRTDVVKIVIDLVSIWLSNNVEEFTNYNIVVYLNTNGIDILAEESSYIIKAITNVISDSTVEILNTPIPSIEWVKDNNVDIMISYYGMSWFNDAVMLTDGETDIPNVTLVVPITSVIGPDSISAGEHKTSNPDDVIQSLAPKINILPVPVQAFSYTEE